MGKGRSGVSKRAQYAMEYLLVIGFAFLMITPLIVVFYTQSSNYNVDITSNQINKISDEIIKAADTVYYLGEPSQILLTVYFPQYINNITVQANRTLAWNFDQQTTTQNIYKQAVAQLNISTLDPRSGIHYVLVRAETMGNKTVVWIEDVEP